MRLLACLALVSCVTDPVADPVSTSVVESALTDPTAAGPYAVGSTRYNAGNVVYPNAPGGPALTVPLSAEVRYPAIASGEGTAALPGVFPIVLFGHGNMLPKDGHFALMAHLASHGYIGVAIDLEPLQAAHDPIELKAEHFLVHVDVLQGAPPVLQGHLDLTSISIGGHSQGGDAALRAAYYAELGGGPFRAVIGIAPIDSTGTTGYQPSVVATPYFGLHGSLDGDVGHSGLFPYASPTKDGLAFRAYDRALGSKAFAYVEGLCHNLLNEQYPICERNPPNPLSAAIHQQALRGYVTAFLAWQVRGDVTARPLLEAGSLPGMSIAVHHQIHDAAAFVLDDFSDTKTNNASSGALNIDTGFVQLADDSLWLLDQSSPHTSGGRMMRWKSPGAAHRLLWKQPIDATKHGVISMRIGQPVGLHDVLVALPQDQSDLDVGQLGMTMTHWIGAHGGIGPSVSVIPEILGARWRIENGSQRLIVIRGATGYAGTFWIAIRNADVPERLGSIAVRVRLTDGDGAAASYTATVTAPVVPPVIMPSPFDSERRTLAALETIRIPLSRYSSIDLSQISEVALELDDRRGQLLLDDLEFAP